MQDSTSCDLVLWNGTVPLTVAKGMIHPQTGTSHNAQLQPDCVSVQVDLVMDRYTHIPLPVPTEEHRVLDDVRSSFIQWPKIGIILDKVISKIIQHEIFEKSTNTHLFLVVIQPQRKSIADDGTSTEVLPHQIADLGQVSVTTTVEASEIPLGTSEVRVGPSEVLPAPEPTPDRQLVTEEEYNCLPKDMQDLHDHLMSLPEDQNEITVTVPPKMFVHDGTHLFISRDDFKDILWASSSNRWLDVSLITIFLMLVIKIILYVYL